MLGAIANLWHNPESRIEVEDVQQHIMVSHPYKHSKCMVPWGLLKFARPFTLGHAAKQKKNIYPHTFYKHSKCMVQWGLLRFARPFTMRHAAKNKILLNIPSAWCHGGFSGLPVLSRCDTLRKKKKTKKHVPSHLLKDPPFPPLPIPLPLTHISLPFPTLLKSDDGGTIAGDI